MKNQVYVIIILLLIFITIFVFSIQFLNSRTFIHFEKNIKNLNKLLSIDQILENLIKSSLLEISISSIFKSSENSFNKNLWDSYPRCLVNYTPSIDEVKKDIIDEITKNLKNLENFINLLNLLLFFYPTKVFIRLNNIKISLPFENNDALSGKLDNKFPINISDIEIEIISLYGNIKKNYRISTYIENVRLFYIYRTINNWINSGKYQDIISKYSKDLFTCFLGYTIANNYNYICESEKKKICEGELIKITYEERLEKIPVRICTEEEKLQIERNNIIVINNCNPGRIHEEINCNILNCIITYKNNQLKLEKGIKETYLFAIGGSDPSPPSGGTPSNCPNPEIIERYDCNKVIIKIESLGQKCVTETPIKNIFSPFDIMICPTSIKCPSKDDIFNIVKKIRSEIEYELNNLFSQDDKISCKVDINVFDYHCENLFVREIYENDCFCLVKEGTKSLIRVIYNVSCVDNKYYSFFNNKLNNLMVKFNLGILGQSFCDPNNIQVDKNNISSFCCKIENVGSSKDCCLDIDINGNCITCPPVNISSNIQKKDSILCIS